MAKQPGRYEFSRKKGRKEGRKEGRRVVWRCVHVVDAYAKVARASGGRRERGRERERVLM